MTKAQYENLRILMADIERLKGTIQSLTNIIQNESTGISIVVKGEAVDIPLAMSPLRALKKQLQDELDTKQAYFQNITFVLP